MAGGRGTGGRSHVGTGKKAVGGSCGYAVCIGFGSRALVQAAVSGPRSPAWRSQKVGHLHVAVHDPAAVQILQSLQKLPVGGGGGSDAKIRVHIRCRHTATGRVGQEGAARVAPVAGPQHQASTLSTHLPTSTHLLQQALDLALLEGVSHGVHQAPQIVGAVLKHLLPTGRGAAGEVGWLPDLLHLPPTPPHPIHPHRHTDPTYTRTNAITSRPHVPGRRCPGGCLSPRA